MGCHGGNAKGRHTGLDSKLSKLEHTFFNACLGIPIWRIRRIKGIWGRMRV